MTSIGKIFSGGVANEIEVLVDQAIDDVTKTVGDGAFQLQSVKIDASNPVVRIFDAPVTISAVANASMAICAPTDAFTIFADSEPVGPPAGSSYTRLAIDGRLGTATAASGKVGVLQLSGEASGAGGFSYTHLLPAPAASTRLAALAGLISSSQLPQLADVSKLRENESLDFTASLNLDFGLTAKYGASTDLSALVNLGSGLSASLKAHVDFSVSAALGLSLYDTMHVTVARASQRNPDWVRISFDRLNRRRITFGAAFALAMQYDAQTAANLLIDKIYALIPFPELSASLKEVVDLAAAGDWKSLEAKISKKAADVVTQFVGDTGWKQWLEGSQQAQDFVAAAKWVVSTYAGLDDKVKSVYEELLSHLDAAGLQHFRDLLKKIASIDINNFDVKSLTSGEFTKVISLIETLSGHDIEELILTGSLKDALQRAVDEAGKIESAIDTAPDKAMAWINGFMSRTGIAGVVTWLQANGTSIQALQQAGDTWIASIVERLTGKALAAIDANDLAALQKFANAVNQFLNAPANFRNQLKSATDKLKGTFGVSLSLELSRVSEWSALVDIEIDPSNVAAVAAVTRFLPAGDAQVLLGKLDSISAQPAPYDIRQVILTSRHVRTSVTALLASFLGLNRSGESRIEESTVRISGGGAVPARRTGVYVGGSMVREIVSGATLEGGAWMRWEGTAASILPGAPYDQVGKSIRLAYVREDAKTEAGELLGMTNLLAKLGFLAGGAVFQAPGPNTETRFSLELDLTSAAVDGMLASSNNQAAWNRDMLNVAHRWFTDEASIDPSRGKQNAQVFANAAFGQLWGNGWMNQAFITAARNGDFGALIMQQMSNEPAVQFLPLAVFVKSRPDRYAGFSSFSTPGTNSPADLAKGARGAARMLATGGTEWDPPLLNFWFVLRRVARLAPATLAATRGVATFRWRADAQSAWSDVQWFVLGPTGVPGGIAAEFPL